jgi:TonB family protein
MSAPDLAPRPSMRLWLVAVVGAVALHAAGIALALAALPPEDSADVRGAPPDVIDVELVAPRAEQVDLPVGPQTEASAASPPVVEQKAEVKPTELPVDVPTDTEDPDRVVTTQETQKPKAEQQEVTPTQTAPSAASAAAIAMAPFTSETLPEAPRAAAPAQGMGESNRIERQRWETMLSVHLNKSKRWPSDRTQRQAHLVVAFVIDRTGHVLSTTIAQSSGDTSFDQAALAMMRRADPVPAPPPTVADEGLSFTLPVDFGGQHRK